MERIFKNATELKAALEEALSIPSELGFNIELRGCNHDFSEFRQAIAGIQFNISHTDYCLTANLQISKAYIGMYSITSIYLTKPDDDGYERIEYSVDDFERVAARFKQTADLFQAYLSNQIFKPEFDAPKEVFNFFADPDIWQSYNGTHRQIFG